MLKESVEIPTLDLVLGDVRQASREYCLVGPVTLKSFVMMCCRLNCTLSTIPKPKLQNFSNLSSKAQDCGGTYGFSSHQGKVSS